MRGRPDIDLVWWATIVYTAHSTVHFLAVPCGTPSIHLFVRLGPGSAAAQLLAAIINVASVLVYPSVVLVDCLLRPFMLHLQRSVLTVSIT